MICAASATAFYCQLLCPFLFLVLLLQSYKGPFGVGRWVYGPQSSALQREIPWLVLDRARWYWKWSTRVPMDGEISLCKALCCCFRWVMVVAKPLVLSRAQDSPRKVQQLR